MFSTLPIRTAFEPDRHGFHFSNNDIEWEIHAGGLGGKNLCGGMVYAALDYYRYRLTIPGDTIAPPKRSPLNSYIYRRQTAAHKISLPNFIVETGLGFFNSESLFVNSLATEFDKIRRKIEHYYPVPLFLVKEGFMHGHHVLIVGCQISPSNGNPILEIYDPNYENEITIIDADYHRKHFRLKSRNGSNRGILQGFFVDSGYQTQKPG